MKKWKKESKKMLRKVPLIVVLGSTGTGKTKLSVELARRFNAEIISADSMQVDEHNLQRDFLILLLPVFIGSHSVTFAVRILTFRFTCNKVRLSHKHRRCPPS